MERASQFRIAALIAVVAAIVFSVWQQGCFRESTKTPPPEKVGAISAIVMPRDSTKGARKTQAPGTTGMAMKSTSASVDTCYYRFQLYVPPSGDIVYDRPVMCKPPLSCIPSVTSITGVPFGSYTAAIVDCLGNRYYYVERKTVTTPNQISEATVITIDKANPSPQITFNVEPAVQ